MLTDRQSKICAAGKPSTIDSKGVGGLLRDYSLQDEVDALFHDAIFPPPIPRTERTRRPSPKDVRNAGFFTEGRVLINPPTKTKYLQLVNELRETTYASYWHKPIGSSRDPAPLLPKGYGRNTKTFGKSTKPKEIAKDIIFPVNPVPDREQQSHGLQSTRNYCEPAFDKNRIYGLKNSRTSSVECCLKNDNIYLGKHLSCPINENEAQFKKANSPALGLYLAPNDNINNVPKGFRFGIQTTRIDETTSHCLKCCKPNPEKEFIHDCLRHLNNVRKCLRKSHPHTVFKTYYLKLKFIDKCKTGWLPKKEIYDFCLINRIYFQSDLLEPLLYVWKAFDGSNIEYETFFRVVNYREPFPDLPKIQDLDESCLHFHTTYSDMVKPGQEQDKRLRAGIPSGRYLDLDYPTVPTGYCRADIMVLPEESDVFSRLSASTFTNFEVTHRDVFAVRDQKSVRRVFEANRDKFTDEEFEKVWKEAAKHHSKGMVCYETFRKALTMHYKANQDK